MTSKDTIALWVLVFFVLVPLGERLDEVTNALKSNRPISTILWHLALSLIVGGSGLFLIIRFIHLREDLMYYEAEEKQREKERSAEKHGNGTKSVP